MRIPILNSSRFATEFRQTRGGMPIAKVDGVWHHITADLSPDRSTPEPQLILELGAEVSLQENTHPMFFDIRRVRGPIGPVFSEGPSYVTQRADRTGAQLKLHDPSKV